MSAEQTKQLEQALRPIAGRLRQAALRPALVRGLELGAALALIPAFLRFATGNWLWGGLALIVLLGGPTVAAVRVLSRGLDLRAAALAVDRRYRWQDRTTTAWSCLAVGGLTPLEQYLAVDVSRRAPQIVAAEVVSLQFPKGLPRAVGLVALVVGALCWPIRTEPRPAPKIVEAGDATPMDSPRVPAAPSVSAETALASLKQFAEVAALPQRVVPESPAPDRRLIQDYFEAVCPPGR